MVQPSDLRPAGLQENPILPPAPKSPEQQSADETLKLWKGRFLKSKEFLTPFFERDQQAFEFWYMWREFRGPYRSNIFPPDVHAAVEAITPRLTKGRPKTIIKARPGIPADVITRVQQVHDAYWDLMGMDQKVETIAKRGTWFGTGLEKVTWKTTGREQPVLDENGYPVIDETGKPMTQFVADFNGPLSEVIDHVRQFIPRGYPTDAELPWEIFQYFKRRSELDPELYGQDKIDQLQASPALPEDPTLDRDKVHRLPRKSQVLGQTDETNLSQMVDPAVMDDDKEDPIVEIWECWERPCRKYPKGRFLTIGNRKVVMRDRKNPMPEGELPSNAFRYIEDTFNYRGLGVAREMERLVLERADKRNQRMDNVSRSIDGMFKLQENEPIEGSELQHQPNGVVRLRDMGALEPLLTPDVTQNAYQEDNIIQQDIAKATGASELVMSGGPRSAKTLGEADQIASSANERYDGVIRRLERFLNRHARLVHLLIRQNILETQELSWTDQDGTVHAVEVNPEDFAAISPDDIRYDAKSVIAYKEVSRQQGMQLMELIDKILTTDPKKMIALRPVIAPLLELYDEIKIQPQQLMEAIEQYLDEKAKEGEQAPPPVDPTKVLATLVDLIKVSPTLVTQEQLDAAFAGVGLPTSEPAEQPMANAPSEGMPSEPAPEMPGQVVTDTTPDPSQIIASASKIQ